MAAGFYLFRAQFPVRTIAKQGKKKYNNNIK